MLAHSRMSVALSPGRYASSPKACALSLRSQARRRQPDLPGSTAVLAHTARRDVAARRRSVLPVCRGINGLTQGYNDTTDQTEEVLDKSSKARLRRWVTNLYDWGLAPENSASNAINTREQQPPTAADKVSMVFVRILQTVLMVALAHHVWQWVYHGTVTTIIMKLAHA